MFNRNKHAVEILRDIIRDQVLTCPNTISLDDLNNHEPKPEDVKILRPIKIKG